MKYEEPECVRMKRRGAELWYEKVKDMSDTERLAFYERRTQEFFEWLENLKKAHGSVVRKD